MGEWRSIVKICNLRYLSIDIDRFFNDIQITKAHTCM